MAQEEDAPNEYSRDLPRKDGDSSLQLVLDQLASLNAKFASANLIYTTDAPTLSREDLGMYAVEERTEDLNYMANNNYTNSYNPGWKNYPNLSYKSNNVENLTPNNFRASNNPNQRIPPGFTFQSRGPNQNSNYRGPEQSYNNPAPPGNRDLAQDTHALLQQFIQTQEKTTQEFLTQFANIDAHFKLVDNQIAQLTSAIQRPSRSLLGNSETNPREHVNAITLRSGKQIPSYTKYLKDILTKKRVAEKETVALTADCSDLIQLELPLKRSDPGSFSIPCKFGNVSIDRALCDLGAGVSLLPLSIFKRLNVGAGVSLLPLSIFKRLNVGELKSIRMTLQLTDRSIKYPTGILEDVPLKVGNFYIPVDFVVLDMDEDSKRRKECKVELEFIHKSCSTVGYRPNVFSTTLSHLIATNSAHLIVPFVSIRERLKEKVEEAFGCEFELFIEFTGLVSWCRGANIGWHSDDNRPYLKQRHFTAVCYLNSYGKDFNGGLFHFQSGEPATFAPSAGDVILYTADSRNIHSVDEVSDGERLTLTLWFSRDSSHDEDSKLVSRLSRHPSLPLSGSLESCLPLPASSNMYWFSPDQEAGSQSIGFNICMARLHVLGFDSDFSQEHENLEHFSEQLMGPIQLAKGGELFNWKFANILHALQVVQFYHWKAHELETLNAGEHIVKEISPLSKPQLERIGALKSVFLHDKPELVSKIFGCSSFENGKNSLDLMGLSAVIVAWNEYTCKLLEELRLFLPHWETYQTIFKVQSC
ncbi:PREDICTED: uncharacterized protein LOC104809799 [Tarenaya hassleriana]|uniref:uncharacterized protein LOC104809799 n=1 Tax=Tarenaya hassleriana TaxID=28532 RepID=UPI00053C343A|nr:PREDICTED: uncharacterized protein LOC104809799 [Tarenaya hassleriana]